MQPDDVLRPICASLAAQDWTGEALTRHLALRLPRLLTRHSANIARALIRAFPGGAAPDPQVILRALRKRPAAVRLYQAALRARAVPPPPLDPPAFRPVPALAHLPLPPLASTDELAFWLGLTPEQLTRFADLHGLSARAPGPFAGHYRHHLIPKADGTLRLIEEPKPLMKRLQRRILAGLLNHIPPHEAAHGFRPGRNCIMAAARHAGEAVVVSFDLADFFPAIPFPRIYGLFRAAGFPPATALPLTGLCTAITHPAVLHSPRLAARDALRARHLPQGAPTSPALANLATFALDCRLAALARSLGAAYTRYADDLTFSGDRHVAAILLRAVPGIVAEEGFRLNPAKTRVMHNGQRQMVTGLTVNARVNLPRPAYDLLKATIHHLSNPADPRRHDIGFLTRLSGQIAWAEQVNPARGSRLRERLAAALE